MARKSNTNSRRSKSAGRTSSGSRRSQRSRRRSNGFGGLFLPFLAIVGMGILVMMVQNGQAFKAPFVQNSDGEIVYSQPLVTNVMESPLFQTQSERAVAIPVTAVPVMNHPASAHSFDSQENSVGQAIYYSSENVSPARPANLSISPSDIPIVAQNPIGNQ